MPRRVLVLHHDECGARALRHGGYCLDDLAGTLRIEVGRGLIQQHHARAHGNNPRQGKALLLPAGELRGGKIKVHVRSHHLQGGGHTLPDLLARKG